jgi:hypothetical protein
MKALTIRQPFAYSISHGSKRIENRSWRPPESMLGERIAIHAAKRIDGQAAIDLGLESTPDVRLPTMAIVATARLVKVIDARPKGQQSFWWTGPLAWVLADVRPTRVIYTPGRLGLWTLPTHIERNIR